MFHEKNYFIFGHDTMLVNDFYSVYIKVKKIKYKF